MQGWLWMAALLAAAVSAPPVPVTRTEPVYPPDATRARYVGVLLVAVDVDAEGKPGAARVLNPAGLGLEASALACVRQWRFRPATKDGAAVAGRALAEVVFRRKYEVFDVKQTAGLAEYTAAVNLLRGDPEFRDPALVMMLLEQSTSNGLAAAEVLLGDVYARGTLGPADPAKGFALVEQAANAGYSEAEFELGLMYQKGLGVAPNVALALNWYRLAVRTGSASAEHNLGVMYERGEGVTADEREAAKWYRRAAEQGLVASEHRLGEMYRDGDGVNRDDAEALYWLTLAGNHGDDEAAQSAGALAGKLTPKQMRRVQARLRSRGRAE